MLPRHLALFIGKHLPLIRLHTRVVAGHEFPVGLIATNQPHAFLFGLHNAHGHGIEIVDSALAITILNGEGHIVEIDITDGGIVLRLLRILESNLDTLLVAFENFLHRYRLAIVKALQSGASDFF